MIGIVDYGFGNLKSVWNAVHDQGFDPLIVKDEADLDETTHVIIPGVGAFDAAIHEMERRQLLAPLKAYAKTGKPMLGICLGMQLLADHGDEGDGACGLGLVPGNVRHLPQDVGLIIPHCGWNTVRFTTPHPLREGLKPAADFYFVHSYKFECARPELALGYTDYGPDFCSAVIKDHVVGFQFHPEKSQANGLRLLENFCRWDGRC